VFERFHRVQNPNFSNVPGTGLGLYISRQLAEQHQGRIVIERSEPGAGTVFALSLPLAPPETRVAADPRSAPRREPHLSPRLETDEAAQAPGKRRYAFPERTKSL